MQGALPWSPRRTLRRRMEGFVLTGSLPGTVGTLSSTPAALHYSESTSDNLTERGRFPASLMVGSSTGDSPGQRLVRPTRSESRGERIGQHCPARHRVLNALRRRERSHGRPAGHGGFPARQRLIAHLRVAMPQVRACGSSLPEHALSIPSIPRHRRGQIQGPTQASGPATPKPPPSPQGTAPTVRAGSRRPCRKSPSSLRKARASDPSPPARRRRRSSCP